MAKAFIISYLVMMGFSGMKQAKESRRRIKRRVSLRYQKIVLVFKGNFPFADNHFHVQIIINRYQIGKFTRRDTAI